MLSQRFPWPLAVILASIIVVIALVGINHWTDISILPSQHHYSQPSSAPASLSRPEHDASNALTSSYPSATSSSTSSPTSISTSSSWSWDLHRDSLNLGLSDDQCDIAFPNLYADLDRARDWHSERRILEKDVRIWYGDKTLKHGQIHVMIYDGQLYVISEKHGEEDKSRAKAALASMYRAISSLPDPRQVPNIEFIVDTADNLGDTPKDRIVWGWCRHRDDNNTFVMPDFDGWSYPDDAVGGYEAFRTKVRAVEKPFENKIPKAVWRGSTGVNHDLRAALVEQAKGKSWSDVKEINWATRDGVMEMQDFCNYQYVIQTEGNSWSGRLRYLHNCLSVPIIHDLDYIAHYYPLLKASGPHQNYIPVRRNFSDLESQMAHQLANPKDSAKIAQESVATFRDRYLTPAAEACYWRRMFKRWSEVQAFETKLWEDVKIDDTKGKTSMQKKIRGVSFERWAFRGEKSFEHGIPIDVKPVGADKERPI